MHSIQQRIETESGDEQYLLRQNSTFHGFGIHAHELCKDQFCDELNMLARNIWVETVPSLQCVFGINYHRPPN